METAGPLIMGSGLLREAISARYAASAIDGRRLSNGATAVLFVMAFTAMDRDGQAHQGRVYYGGWDKLAREALGYANGTLSNSGKQAVKRAISELVERKMIEQIGGGTNGQKAVYMVLPDL